MLKIDREFAGRNSSLILLILVPCCQAQGPTPGPTQGQGQGQDMVWSQSGQVMSGQTLTPTLTQMWDLSLTKIARIKKDHNN